MQKILYKWTNNGGETGGRDIKENWLTWRNVSLIDYVPPIILYYGRTICNYTYHVICNLLRKSLTNDTSYPSLGIF